MARHWWMLGWLCAAFGVACGDGASSSLPSGALDAEAAGSHKVDTAYDAFAASYEDCLTRYSAGEFTSATEVGGCMNDGLAASKLDESATGLRRRVEAVERRAEGDCKAAAHKLAGAVRSQQAVPGALRTAIAAADQVAVHDAFVGWKAAAARVHKLDRALVQACA